MLSNAMSAGGFTEVSLVVHPEDFPGDYYKLNERRVHVGVEYRGSEVKWSDILS